jgi:hypothetical protein
MNHFFFVSAHGLLLITLPRSFTKNCEEFILAFLHLLRRDSSVGIANDYELDGVGIESLWC